MRAASSKESSGVGGLLVACEPRPVAAPLCAAVCDDVASGLPTYPAAAKLVAVAFDGPAKGVGGLRVCTKTIGVVPALGP